MPTEYFGYQTYPNQSLSQFPFNSYTDYNIFWPWFSYADVDATVFYYVNLLIIQYFSKPKAREHIFNLVSPVIMNLLPQQVQEGFNLETAVGVQLDTLGKYVGVTRNGFGPNGPITLNDSDFRTFITLAIVNNSSNGTLFAIQQLLHTYFNNEILVFDHETMRMSYYLNSDSTSLDLATLFITEGKLPKPLGVELSSVIYLPLEELNELFSCRTYALPVFHGSPLNNYSSYNMDYPMLSYANALVV